MKIFKFLGIENYFTYWIRNNSDLSVEFNNAKKERAKTNPAINKCYRCGQIKEINNFGKDKTTASGFSDTVKTVIEKMQKNII